MTFSKLLAPFMPFVSDAIYLNLNPAKTSVHLADWPKFDPKLIDKKLNKEMNLMRSVVTLGHALRDKSNLKVRQPLSKLILVLPAGIKKTMIESYRDVILEEINAKELAFEKDGRLATPVLTVDARKIGPRFGADTQTIIVASKQGDYAIQHDGTVKIPVQKLSV